MLKNMVLLFSKPLGWKTLSFSVYKMQGELNPNLKFFNNLGASSIKSKINDNEIKDSQNEEWKECINVLKMYSFEESECFQMIRSYPQLANVPTSKLQETIDTWRNCPINLDKLRETFYKQPSLLDVEADEIKRRVPHLNILFKSLGSWSDLLLLCPNVMFDDWKQVQNKIHYIIKEKGIRSEKLIKSFALTKPLDFIKLRFEIAEKCGKFKINIKEPHKKVKFDKTNNPGLAAIVDSPDKSFAKKMNITLEEYRVFEDLFYSKDIESDDED